MWISPREGALYTSGGYSNYRRCFGNDFWKFNLSSSEWTWIAGNFSCGIQERLPKHGVKKVFSSDNFPGARLTTAYWENTNQDMFYFYSGFGAYYGSKIITFADHINVYYDGGDDVWAYDVKLKQWACIAGSSGLNSRPITTAPGTEKL